MTDHAAFNFRISGAKVPGETIGRLLDGLQRIEDLPGVDAVGVTATDVAGGWAIEGHGQAETPDQHAEALTYVRDLASAPDAHTGSSEFSSPYLTAANFHSPPEGDGGEPAGAAGQAGGAPAGGDGPGEAP